MNSNSINRHMSQKIRVYYSNLERFEICIFVVIAQHSFAPLLMYLYLRHSSLFRITKEDHISHPFPQYVLKRVLQWLNSNMDIRKSRCRDQAGCPLTVLNLKFQRLSIFFWKSQESDPILGIASPEGHSV